MSHSVRGANFYFCAERHEGTYAYLTQPGTPSERLWPRRPTRLKNDSVLWQSCSEDQFVYAPLRKGRSPEPSRHKECSFVGTLHLLVNEGLSRLVSLRKQESFTQKTKFKAIVESKCNHQL
jgi:hypothetical protein